MQIKLQHFFLNLSPGYVRDSVQRTRHSHTFLMRVKREATFLMTTWKCMCSVTYCWLLNHSKIQWLNPHRCYSSHFCELARWPCAPCNVGQGHSCSCTQLGAQLGIECPRLLFFFMGSFLCIWPLIIQEPSPRIHHVSWIPRKQKWKFMDQV